MTRRGYPFGALALALAFCGLADAATSRAIVVSAGRASVDPITAKATDSLDEPLAPIWISECPDGQVLVGVRLLQSSGLSGLSAICSRLEHDGRGFAWATAPTPVKGPPKPPPPKMITRVAEREVHGAIGSYTDENIFEARILVSFPLMVEETIPDPALPPPPVVVEFEGKAQDVTCPAGSFVQGIRIGPLQQGSIKRFDLNCASAGRETTVVAALGGERPNKAAKRQDATDDAAKMQRVDCRSFAANPEDGIAVKAIFGTLNNGHVESVGVNCAPAVDRYSAIHAVAAVAARFVERLEVALGIPKTIETPKSDKGKQVATACSSKDGDACAQHDAEAFCATAGYARAAAFELGKKTSIAVRTDGEVCKKGECHAFASITCGGGRHIYAAARTGSEIALAGAEPNGWASWPQSVAGKASPAPYLVGAVFGK